MAIRYFFSQARLSTLLSPNVTVNDKHFDSMKKYLPV